MVKAYKGFNKDLKCRDFQYEIGGEYIEEKAEMCESGFHACEYPLDVFNYYNPTNRFCEVELDEVSGEKREDTKICGRKIKIGAEIGLKGMIEAGVKFIFEKVDWENAKESNTDNYSAATNTGNQSAATNTGYKSAATNTGYQSAATNTGYKSAATNTGDQSAAINTGYYSAATNTGYKSAATVEGKDSVAMAMGIESKAKGAKGCWIVLAEWVQDDNCNWHIKRVESKKVDGKTIKADTFYTLKDGEFIETE